jgi:hypothetical protein
MEFSAAGREDSHKKTIYEMPELHDPHCQRDQPVNRAANRSIQMEKRTHSNPERS